MFTLATILLLGFGLVLPHGVASENVAAMFWDIDALRWLLLGLWLVIVLEGIAGLVAALRARTPSAVMRFLLVAVLPPLRLAISPQAPPGWIWLPLTGWRRHGPGLFRRMELRFALPMLVVATLIIPVIGLELLFAEELARNPRMAAGLHGLTSLIWFAFTTEFILMITVARKKLQYAREHWINLLIILLPLVAFLRMLFLIKALRAAKMSQAVQTVRLRVVLTRAHRIAMLLNLLERLLVLKPRLYLKILRGREERSLRELSDTRRRIREMEMRIARQARERGD
ncbi:MAG: potassium channel protein - like protein [Thioalkalivibrio sp.]|nr:MAG: potassium channel protein - like protein [Thioalkalivibrio sp.]